MNSTITLDRPDLYFARLAEFERRHWWSKSMRRIAHAWLSAELREGRAVDLIDVGCGTGYMLGFWKEHLTIGRAVGVEPRPEAISRNVDRDIEIHQGAASDLPFEDASFEVSTCFDVLQHLDAAEEPRALAEFRRVLKPGGVLLVRTNAESRHRRLPERLSRAGFVVRRARRVNALPSLAQEIRGRLFPQTASAPRGAGLPSVTPDGLGFRLMAGVSALETWALVRLGLSLPFGHSVMALAIRPF